MVIESFDSHEQELISAARLVAEAAAARLADLSVRSGARTLRLPFPTATTLLVRVDPLSFDDDVVDVRLIEILDGEGDRLWAAVTGVAPRVPGVNGGWNSLSAAARTRLAEALAHATPRHCGWRSRQAEPDAEVLRGSPGPGVLYLVDLPTPDE